MLRVRFLHHQLSVLQPASANAQTTGKQGIVWSQNLKILMFQPAKRHKISHKCYLHKKFHWIFNKSSAMEISMFQPAVSAGFFPPCAKNFCVWPRWWKILYPKIFHVWKRYFHLPIKICQDSGQRNMRWRRNLLLAAIIVGNSVSPLSLYRVWQCKGFTSIPQCNDIIIQVIQFVTFLSPIVGDPTNIDGNAELPTNWSRFPVPQIFGVKNLNQTLLPPGSLT